jgi:ERCC4-type nuclease
MPIFVDDREPEEVIKGLRRQNLAVEIHHNDSGDYVFGEVAIERKTISDLIGSVCSKKHRLWDQLGTMKDTYQQPMLLVEGMINWKDPYLSGILTTVLLFWKYQTIFTLGMEETALAVGHLFTKQGIGRSGRIPPAAVKKHSTPKEILWEMLQCIEGVGPKTAKKILDVIPLEDLVNMDIFRLDEELKSVHGLPSRSRKLMTQVFRGGEVEEH